MVGVIAYYKVLFDNITSYSGTGLLFVLFLISTFFVYFREKDKSKRKMLVAFPVIILAIIFCPLWAIYIDKRNDAVILYRLFWIIPTVVITGYAFTEAISMVPEKHRFLLFSASAVIIMLSGTYIYSNRYFSKAENVYHVPDTVVKICDEIIVPGREVRACFPEEFIQYVRQYTSLVMLPYGRETLLMGETYMGHSEIKYQLSKKVVDSKILTDCLRESDTHYLIVDSEKAFSESLWNYDFCYVTTIDGYDIYLDNNAYLGLSMGK